MTRQFVNWGIRLTMVLGAVYVYKYRQDCLETHLDETWKKVGALFAAVLLFLKA